MSCIRSINQLFVHFKIKVFVESCILLWLLRHAFYVTLIQILFFKFHFLRLREKYSKNILKNIVSKICYEIKIK